MPMIAFGNHCSVIVPTQERERIQKFYGQVLGGEIIQSQEARDFVRLGDAFYIILYGDVSDCSALQRTAQTVWLELKSDDVDGMRRRIVESGLVRELDIPDPHLYFQAPGGQCWRLVGIDEDLSFYEGAAEGPSVARVKEALKGGSTK